MKIKLSAAFLILLIALAILHAPGLFQGKVYGDEDLLAVFFADKCRLHNLWLGKESWSFWDPLPFLGMPRLANLQMGWFSPDNLYFLVLDPLTAWRFYPFLADLGLLVCFYYFLRSRVSPTAAWLGAGFYVFSGDVLKTSQDSPVKAALMAMMLVLACNERWLRSGRRRYLLGLALAAAWQMSTGAVSQLYYQMLSLPFLCLVQIWQAPPPTRLRRGLLGILTFVGATLALLFPWIPLLEWSAHGSRQLMGGASFAEAYSLNFKELLCVFVDETAAFVPLIPEHGGGYPLTTGFSFSVLLLVIYACRKPGASRILLLLSVLISLQMLGERGFFLWILHKAAPFTQQVRGPHRFFYTAALLWVQVAALGLDELLRKRRQLAWGLCLWAIGLNLWAMQPRIAVSYLDAGAFAGIPLPPEGPGRVAVNFARVPRPPLQWLSYPLTQGRATAVIPNVLCEGNYFRGLLYSQYGLKGKSLLSELVYSFAPVPPAHPNQPILRSWGLAWVLQPQGEGFAWQALGASPHHWTVVQLNAMADAEAENNWATRSDWKPFEQACLAGEVPTLGTVPAQILAAHDTPDEQILQTRGEASLLISADNWDPGWECWIDGRPAEVRRANLALKACLLPAGEHEVRWRYRMLWPKKAVLPVSLGLMLLAGVALLTRKGGGR